MIVHCPACQQGFDITGYPADFRFACAHCGHMIDAESLGASPSSPAHEAASISSEDLSSAHGQTGIDGLHAPEAFLHPTQQEQESTTEHSTVQQGSESTVRMRSPVLNNQPNAAPRTPAPANASEGIRIGIEDDDDLTGHTMANAQAQDDDFDPSQHHEDDDMDHTLGAAPVSEHYESPQESTAISANPLLQVNQYGAPVQASFQLQDDPLAQEESTAISANPLLTAPQTPPPSSNAGWNEQPFDPSQSVSHYPSPNVIVQPQLSEPAHTPQDTPQSTPEPVNPDALLEASNEVDLVVPQTDRRGTVGVFLLFTAVLGPLCFLLGLLSYRQIKRSGEAFGGKGQALFAMIGGALQSLVMAGVLGLFVFFPDGHPALNAISQAYHKLTGLSSYPDFSKRPPQPERLTKGNALKLILEASRPPGQPPSVTPKHLYVYQEPGARHAYAHWREARIKQNQRTLLLYSNRKHWHVASMYLGKSFEVRCSSPGQSVLTAAIARKLIKQFWKVRGKFSGVRITHLYIHQMPNQRRAYAYWKLIKQVSGSPIKQWRIKSIFHYSNQGAWYISRYAMRIHPSERFTHMKQAPGTLTTTLAQAMLNEYHKDNQQPLSLNHLFVVNAPKHKRAFAYWHNGRQATRSLFRHTNAGAWVLAQVSRKSQHTYKYTLSSLTTDNAKKIIMRYLRNHTRAMLQGPFKKAGAKGKPPIRLPKIKRVAIYHPTSSTKAHIRWEAAFSKKQMFMESIFIRTQNGTWTLFQPLTQQHFDLRFTHKQSGPLTATMAKEILLQFWREDENIEKFNGARIEALYIFQDASKGKQIAWAHWRKTQSGMKTRMRSEFYRALDGHWYLGTYDMGLGYRASTSLQSPIVLRTEAAIKLLDTQLKSNAKTKDASIVAPYVYQEPNQPIAYIRWFLINHKKTKKMNSLVHRSSDGKWYLSILSTPQLTPTELQ